MPTPYPWPVKPFARQHPVRAFFNDPRIAGREPRIPLRHRHLGARRHRRLRGHARQGVHRGSRARGRRPGADGPRVRLLARQARGRAPPAGGPAPAARAHRGALGPRALRREHERALPRPDPAGCADSPSSTSGHPTSRADPVPARQEGAGPRSHQGPACRSAASPTTRRRSPCPSRGRTCPSRRRGCATASFCAGVCVQPLRAGVDLRTFRTPDAFHVVYGPDTRQNHPNKPGHLRASTSRTTGTARPSRTATTGSRSRPPTSTATAPTSALPFTIRNGTLAAPRGTEDPHAAPLALTRARTPAGRNRARPAVAHRWGQEAPGRMLADERRPDGSADPHA